MSLVCEEPWSNVDELDFVTFSDCHINNNYIKSFYLAVICASALLVSFSSYKLFKIVKGGKFDISYIPHLCCICWWGCGLNIIDSYLYKYLTFTKMADISTVGTLLCVLSAILYIPGCWLTIVYLMAVSLSAEIGRKGAAMMAKLNRLALFLCGTSCTLYASNIMLLLIGDSMLRPMSYGWAICICGAAGCYCIFIAVYGYKVDTLLTKVIDSSGELQKNISKEKARDKVKSVIKNRRILRIGVPVLSGGTGISVCICGAMMVYDESARNSWMTFNLMYFMASLLGTGFLCVVNTAPPNNRTSNLMFLGGRNRIPGRSDRMGGALSILEKASSHVGDTMYRQSKRLSGVISNSTSFAVAAAVARSRRLSSMTRNSVGLSAISEAALAELREEMGAESESSSSHGDGPSQEKRMVGQPVGAMPPAGKFNTIAEESLRRNSGQMDAIDELFDKGNESKSLRPLKNIEGNRKKMKSKLVFIDVPAISVDAQQLAEEDEIDF